MSGMKYKKFLFRNRKIRRELREFYFPVGASSFGIAAALFSYRERRFRPTFELPTIQELSRQAMDRGAKCGHFCT
jgi:hypothetical protein